MENPDQSFRKTKIVNFDIIHHECRGDKLEKSYEYYQTVLKVNFNKYKKEMKKRYYLVHLGIRTNFSSQFILKKILY